MSAGGASREAILHRVRTATENAEPGRRGEAYAALPRNYIRHGALSAEARVALMIERLRGYDATVTECRPDELAAAIAAQLTASGRRRFVAPPGLPAAWRPDGFAWTVDQGLTAAEVEAAEGVVTASSGGIAESGTIVLHHSPAEGRRVLTLLPDWHLCVLKASDVVETLPEYFDRCGTSEQVSGGSGRLPRLVTWISGPSATADIEMTRIKGVHGPRYLHVVVVRDDRDGERGREADRAAGEAR